MKKLIVFIPENIFIKYFVFNVYSGNFLEQSKLNEEEKGSYKLLDCGKVKFRSPVNSTNEVIKLINRFKPDSAAIRILCGGNEFKDVTIYDELVLDKLEKLIPQSPLDMPVIIELIKSIKDAIPLLEIFLFFETAFFSSLPVYEQLYAVDNNLFNMEIKRSGYHGLFHNAVLEDIKNKDKSVRKIISICLEPVPDIAAIYDGKPLMISGGTTPVEGIPGDTTCGELDPGILIMIEEKKKLGAEIINEIITGRSGLSAIAGVNVSINDIFKDEKKYKEAAQFLKYKILLSCGSAIATMNGANAIGFSGRYIEAAESLSEWLIPELKRSATNEFNPKIFFMKNKPEEIIADYCVHSVCLKE